MTLPDLSESCDSLVSYVETVGVNPENTIMTVCLLGGELTTLNYDYLKKMKALVEYKFRHFKGVEIGLQTNLIVSGDKLLNIYDLFNGNVGTSVDHFTSSRRFKGSADTYKKIYSDNIALLGKERNAVLGACYVVAERVELAVEEYRLAEAGRYPLKLIAARQNYEGVKTIEAETQRKALSDVFLDIFDEWFLKGAIPLDPFLYMVNRKISSMESAHDTAIESCNFTDKCHKQGVCIEPNGDFYFCQELADLKTLKLGNLITREFDRTPIAVSEFRTANIMASCSSCEHYTSCRGGCMSYAVDAGLGFNSKDPYCGLYKSIYGRIDLAIENHGVSKVKQWVKEIS